MPDRSTQGKTVESLKELPQVCRVRASCQPQSKEVSKEAFVWAANFGQITAQNLA